MGEPVSHRYSKNYASRIRATHKWSPTGSPEKTVHESCVDTPRVNETCPGLVCAGTPSFDPKGPKLRSRSPGEFNGKTSYQAKKLNMTMADHLRFDDSDNPRGKDYSTRIRATHHWEDEVGGVKRLVHSRVVPERTVADVPNQSLACVLQHDANLERDAQARLHRSRSCPAPKEELNLRKIDDRGENRHAGVASASLGTDRLGHGKRVLGTDTVEKTGRIFKPLGVEHTHDEHRSRMINEEGYAKTCDAIREHSRNYRKVGKEIKENGSVSTGVANAMVWSA